MLPDLRIIDANANRAREGLRFLEDHARFEINDADLARTFKTLRHDLTSAVAAMLAAANADTTALLASRDTPGDVGTTTKTRAEQSRETLIDAINAAAGRAAEALRVLQELAKVRSAADAAATFERSRYTLYDAHKRLVLALARPARQWRLCLLLTESLCKRPWLDVARAALDGGVDAIQLREKSLTDSDLLARALTLRDECSRRGAALIINDRVDIAILARADAVHLGQTDLSIAHARALAGPRMLIGISTHDLHEARAALDARADYLGVGAMFATTTKPRETSGPAYLRDLLAIAPATPHLAIGGITAANLPQLLAVGCKGIAVSSTICSAESPGQAAAHLCQLLA